MTRDTDPDDGRYTLAILTEAGHRKVDDAAPGHVETVQQIVFDSLSRAQSRQLGEICRRILASIQADGAWVPPGRGR